MSEREELLALRRLAELEARAGAAPGQQPAGGGGLTPEEQRELEALRARFPRAQR